MSNRFSSSSSTVLTAEVQEAKELIQKVVAKLKVSACSQ